MKLHSMREVEEALRPYYEVAKQTTGKGITVERVARLMKHIGNPEKTLKVVHVAGTSGKTSTTTYIAQLLLAAGQKVGHTISPHVSSLTERVQLNGVPLEERRFCELLGEFLDLVADAPETPSWFELLIAFSLWVFAQEKVDYAVLETGMGGLHDATNVCDLPDKVAVITDIGLDHTEWLGNTPMQIAHQKAGIIHPGNAVFMYGQGAEVMQVVKFKVNQTKKAELYVQSEELLEGIYAEKFTETLPMYQKRNWLLAYAVYRYLVRRDKLPLLPTEKLQSTQQQVPGRMEKLYIAGKTVILDGAHNTPKMRAFVDSFKQQYPGLRVPVMIALKKDKEEAEIGPIVSEISNRLITTAFRGSQDWPTTAQDPSYLKTVMQAYGPETVAAETVEQGLQALLSADDSVVVVTGSLYLVSQVRPILLGMQVG